jgi:hypothetical protein
LKFAVAGLVGGAARAAEEPKRPIATSAGETIFPI